MLNGTITKINIIDAPGFSDFIGDVKSALKICDTAVMVVKSAEGIEVGTDDCQRVLLMNINFLHP